MNKTVPKISALLLIAVCMLQPVASFAQSVSSPPRAGVADLLESVTPAVVNIAVTGHVQIQQNPLLNDPNFRRFFNVPEQPESRQTQSVGSGVIIDADKGYVLTNHHVIDSAEQITVTLQDKREVKATLIGSDAGTDIALLHIEADNLHAIPTSDSDTLRVGDMVLAIGNPFGLGQTVTTGIVSALGRAGLNAESYEDFIQTDASINPGNSGGALVDYNGSLIGINSAIIAPSGGNVGIGFAVPIDMALSVIDQLVEYGEVRRGMLGVTISDLTPDVVDALDLNVNEGAVVQGVEPGSPAEKAGIEAGDIIVGVNNSAVVSGTDLRNTIGLVRAGDTIAIDVVRDKQHLNLEATIASVGSKTLSSKGGVDSVLQGVELSSIPQDHPSYKKVKGVLVSSLDPSSRAARQGLELNDIITAVNRQNVDSPAAVKSLLGDGGQTVALSIVRDGRRLFLILR